MLAPLLVLFTLLGSAHSFPTDSLPTASKDKSVSVKLNGKTYKNKGLVAFGRIPPDAKESTGDTIGGIGSAIALKRGSWKKFKNDTFAGTFVVHPDRGFNVEGPINYQARQLEIDFVLNPYYGSENLDFETAQKTLQFSYSKTTLQWERQNAATTGLDGVAVRPPQRGFPLNQMADPELPIADTVPHLTIDAEGLVSNADGSFWVSDEYGPYIYRFSASGQLLQTIQPPNAFLPRDSSGQLAFSSLSNPSTGRAGNKGFESLTLDPDNGILYAMLQAATIQDGGSDKLTSRHTRMLAYDVSNPRIRPKLVGEWVVPLPLSSKNKTLECNELLYLNRGVFLALSRDGDGRSGDDTKSKYKQIDLIDISKATDIHGTKFDNPKNPVAPNGELDKKVKPAKYVSFANFIDDDQLAKFGLHNDDPDDQTLIAAKWESLAIAPIDDPAFPHDFFVFTAADNDFITTNGVSLGKPYNAGLDVDNQFLVLRVTIPKLTQRDIRSRIRA